MLDYQYVYLMRKQGSRKHKIGISHRPKRRLTTVRKGVRADVNIVVCRKVFFARGVEKFLHNYFLTTRFFFHNAGKGAGRTEWFRFNIFERWTARAWIIFFGWFPQLVMLGAIWYALVQYDEAFGLFP